MTQGADLGKHTAEGMAEEFIEGALQHFNTGLHKDIPLEQLAREYLDQLPQSLAASGAMGGGQAGLGRNSQRPGGGTGQSPAFSIPDTTTHGTRLGDALSRQPGGLAGAIADAKQLWQQKGGRLAGDKTHVFHSAEDLLNSDYARQHPFSEQQMAALRDAEGFFDPRTGQTVIIAGNVRLRPGENPQAALTRVLLHERVGHDGLNALLNSSGAAAGDKPTLIQTRWANLQQQLLLHQRDVIESIAAEPGYAHLKGNTEALALEWFARQAEARPELLTQPSLVMRMWDNFKEGVADLMARLGLDPLKGKDLDTQAMALLKRARQAALQGGNGPMQGGALGEGLQFSMGGAGKNAGDNSGIHQVDNGRVQKLPSTIDIKGPSPRFPAQDPILLDSHQRRLNERRRENARNRDAEAALLSESEARVRHPDTGTQAIRQRIAHAAEGGDKAEQFVKTSDIGGKHVNKVDVLETPGKLAVIHKPANGQDKKKRRAGIAPETTGKREVAASHLAEALGIDLVPPTTMITHDGQPGSAQAFVSGMISGKRAAKEHGIAVDSGTKAPVNLPDATAENWQLMDDLLMQSDRHQDNYMLRLENGQITGVALIDNGYSLPAHIGVVEKRYRGPREGASLPPINQARLQRMLDQEPHLRQSLSGLLEEEALDGLFARAKALLSRGKYGNFTLDEINAHLPVEKQRSRPAAYNDENE